MGGLLKSPDPGFAVTRDALQVMAMAGMSAMNENTTIPDLRFAVTAEIHNPNLLGGVADPGHIRSSETGNQCLKFTSRCS